jgi:membrane protease YdiL (CAAX protease family)
VAAFRSRLWLGGLVVYAASPAIGAWIISSIATTQESGFHRLRESFTRRVQWRWWAAAFFSPLLLLSAAEVLSHWILPNRTPTLQPATGRGLLLTVVISIAANPWEEIGWRGFAFTRLQTRMPALQAALIVGLLTALWHIPLFLWPGSPMSKFPYFLWAICSVGTSIVFAWLYCSSGQGLGVTMLAHITLNIFGAIVGLRSHAVLAIVILIAALAIVLFAGPSLNSSASDKTAP